MATGEHRPLECQLKLLQGSEPWLLVKHSRGAFRLPLTAELSELHRGLLEGWSAARETPRHAQGMVRIPLAELLRLQILDARSSGDSVDADWRPWDSRSDR